MFELPPLHYPYPSVINPCADEVQEAITGWMNQHSYLKTEKLARRFAAGKFAYVTARAHPHASYESVLLVATYMSWLFMLDDLCDEAELGRSPDELRALHTRIVEVMRSPHRESESDPVLLGLIDVWERMVARATPQWTARFIHTFEDYALGCQWEAHNRATQAVPSLESYLKMRRKTSALEIFFDLIELADDVYLPQWVLQNEHVKALKVLANDGVAWFNDIVSLEKEIRSGDMHNLVLVLQHAKNLTLQEAVDQTGDMFNQRMAAYTVYENHRPLLDSKIEAELGRYLAGLRYWVRGNMDWSFETGRYGQAPKAAPEKAVG